MDETLENKNLVDNIVSQKDYKPTPYKQTNWEGLDKVDKNPKFKAINVDILPNQNLKIDSMFERFDLEYKNDDILEQDIDNNSETQIINDEYLELIKLQAYEEGKAAGIEEGMITAQESIMEKYELLANTVKGITDAVNSEIQNRLKEMEEKALSLSLDIAKKLVEISVEAKPEYILSVIRTALKNLGASKPLVVKVSNQDYEFLQVVGLPEDLTSEGLKIEYLPDEKVLSGCIVETDHGEINLELDSMWNEIKNKLFSSLKA